MSFMWQFHCVTIPKPDHGGSILGHLLALPHWIPLNHLQIPHDPVWTPQVWRGVNEAIVKNCKMSHSSPLWLSFPWKPSGIYRGVPIHGGSPSRHHGFQYSSSWWSMTCIFRAPPQIIHFTGIFPYMNGWLSNELVKWMILGTIIYKGTIIYGTSSLIHFGYPMVPSFMETPHSHGSESLRRQFPRYPDFPQFTAAAVTRPEPCTAQGTQGSGS